MELHVLPSVGLERLNIQVDNGQTATLDDPKQDITCKIPYAASVPSLLIIRTWHKLWAGICLDGEPHVHSGN